MSDLDLHNFVLGFTYSTCSSASLIGTIQYDESDDSLPVRHTNQLEEIRLALTDKILKEQVKIMINLYSQAQECNDELLKAFATRTKSPFPKTKRDMGKIYKKLGRTIGPNYYPIILAEDGPSKIVEKNTAIVTELIKTRGIIIKRVIGLYPELIDSDRLSDDDKSFIGN